MSIQPIARQALGRVGLLPAARWLRRMPGRLGEEALRELEQSIDVPALRIRVPDIDEAHVGAAREMQELGPLHTRFLETVATSPERAMGRELAGFVAWFTRTQRPRRILDLGAGFAAALFRRYAQQADAPVEVWSVASRSGDVARTATFLADHALPTDRLTTWNDFRATTEAGFDLVLHDLEDGAMLRRTALPNAIARTRSGGWILVDGMQRPDDQTAVRQLLALSRLPSWSLRRWTLDRFGRHAQLVAR